MTIQWYINRLKCMSSGEIVFRLRQHVKKIYENIRYQHRYFPKVHLMLPAYNIFNVDNAETRIDSITVTIFGKKIDLGPKINWHKDYCTGKEFPQEFSKNIDIENEKYGSVKPVWELNRLHFMPKLALGYRKFNKQEDLDLFISITSSWIDDNQYFKGINWFSNIEVNLRLISWFWSWNFLEASKLLEYNKEFKDFVEKKWVPAIYLHCKYSSGNRSKYSSANNHLIAEATGLFVSANLWKFKESEKWLKDSKHILEKEIVKQHTVEGINREEAAGYIKFVTDLFMLAYIVGEKTGNRFSDVYVKCLKNITYYISNLVDNKGNVPGYGDDDDSVILSLDSHDKVNNWQSLLCSGATIFQDPVLKSITNRFDFKNQVLFGNGGENIYNSILADKKPRESILYKNSGHFILRKETGAKEIYMHLKNSPLGYLSISAHGHADALSFTLNVDGFPYFIDSGTYSYGAKPKWRNYFKGTLAHNTIRVDKKDQATIGGPTIWLDHYKCKLIKAESNPEMDYILATHDGYRKSGVEHVREITFIKNKNHFIIRDMIQINDSKLHIIEIPFHLNPKTEVLSIDKNNYLLKHDNSRAVSVQLDNRLSPEIISGQDEPILGWYSNAYFHKEKARVIYNQIKTNKSNVITNNIIIE